MPSGCEAEDLQEEIASTFKRSLSNVTEISVDVRVESAMCKTRDQRDNVGKSFSMGEIITWILFSTLIFLTITASLCEFITPNVNVDDKSMQRSESTFFKALNAFSVQKNIETLLKTDKKEEIRIIDGARFLNALALIISHKSMALLYNPYINRTAMSETLGMAWSIIGRTAIIYTETFIFLSGLLTANSFINDLKKTERINFKDKLISRLFRITPNLITIILFCTYILPKMGSGPMWPLVIEEHSHLCKQYMWRNMLYIHNYFGFENMCLTHTHQVGIDMQLFFICPLIVYAIWHKPKLGILTLAVIGIISTLLRFWVTYSRKLSTVIYFGMSVGQLFDTANYSYILPTHRATVYGMGIMMAFLLHYKFKTDLSKVRTGIYWFIAASLALICVVGPFHMSLIGFEYDPLQSAIYNAFSPIVWGIFLSWGVWAANNECAGWFGDILSWKRFNTFTKIAYAVYLTQFPVFFYNVGTQRSSEYYKPTLMLNLIEMGFIVFVSAVLTVIVEIPFQKIHKLFFMNTSNSKTKRNMGKNDDNNNMVKTEKNNTTKKSL